MQWLGILLELHQGPDAMRVANLGIAREGINSFWPFARAQVWFYEGGDSGPLAALVGNEPPEVRWLLLDSYQLVHRYAEAREILDGATAETWRWHSINYPPLYRVGPTPVADRRGWLDLLRADAQLFMGNGADAIRTAAEAEAITRGKPDVSDQINAHFVATMIMAWAGTRDAAALRIEEMLTDRPVVFPGEITGNPIWTVPLAGNAHYAALRARLVAQMKATRLE